MRIRMPVLAAMLCLAVGLPAGAMVVAERGQSRAVIVVGADARPREMLAAEDLAHYLGAMTGATFEIRHQPADGPCIYVGHSGATTPILQDLRDRNAPADSFVIRCKGDQLYLVGSDVDAMAYDFPDEGTCNAVYTFLDELGCRWYFPGELGEVVPRRDRIEIDEQDRFIKPSFWRRGSVWGGDDSTEWMRRNRGILRATFDPAFRAEGHP